MTAAHLMQTYASLPVAFARGEGAWLWDTEGKRYLDALARRAGGETHPHFQPVSRARAGAPRGKALRARGDGQRFFLQFGVGSERVRDQARAPAWAPARH